MLLQQIFFALVTIYLSYRAFNLFSRIRRNILLGEDEDLTDNAPQRWKNVFLIAFGQKKMFKRIVPAVLHFFIYAAFLATQIELLEILIDGFFGVHRFFADKIGFLYPVIISTIEILSFLAMIATVVFLIRRNVLKIDRLHKPEMKNWPTIDANLILFGELALITGIVCMNGADVCLQEVDPQNYHHTGFFAISSWMGPLLFGWMDAGFLQIVERFGWWLHIGTVLAFLNYLPISKHLHIMLAFPNTYYAKLNSRGEMTNMPSIMNEVKSMMGIGDAADAEAPPADEELPAFGSNDIFTLSWKNIMDAYTCTECGRCTSVCPANMTGKKLSPRKIMMDIRDRAEEVGANMDCGESQYIKEEVRATAKKITKENYDDGKSLFDYISKEELHACTTCNACVEACPVMINPLEPILKMRRYEILTDSAGPKDWVPMFTSIENNGAVWQLPDARDKWTEELN